MFAALPGYKQVSIQKIEEVPYEKFFDHRSLRSRLSRKAAFIFNQKIKATNGALAPLGVLWSIMKKQIEVRPLTRGEESIWVSLGVAEAEKETQRVKLVEYLDQNLSLPEKNFLLAYWQGRVVGKLSGILSSTGYVAKKMILDQEADKREVSASLFNYVRQFGPVQALSWADQTDDREWRETLERNGFFILVDKAYFKRNISDYVMPPGEILRYKSMKEVGREMMLNVHSLTYAENPNRNFSSPEKDFKSHEESAGPLFDQQGWFVAFLNDQPIGVLLPQRFPDSPREGTLMSIGVTREYRGRKFGRMLHAKGLEILSRQGATTYIGSTDMRNLPMIRIFEINGCEKFGIRSTHLDSASISS